MYDNQAGLSPMSVKMPTDPAERAAYMPWAHVLDLISAAVEPQRALLVKGAALGLSVYDKPWRRPMTDIDLIVWPHERQTIIDSLVDAGFEATPLDERRRYSRAILGDRSLVYRRRWPVDIHERLDKIAPRPIDYGRIFARASEAPRLPQLLIPTLEDHAMLVILHAAGTEFRHEHVWRDLQMLFDAGIDHELLAYRIERARLRTAAYVTFRTLAKLDAPAIPHDFAEQFRPSGARLEALRRWYDIGRFPLHHRPPELGLPWVARQALLRDDLGSWAVHVARYSRARVRDFLSTYQWNTGQKDTD